MQLANAAINDAAAAYVEIAKDDKHVMDAGVKHTCVLSNKIAVLPTKKEVGDLRVLGVGVDMLSVETYSIARIFGVHFKSGEWGNHPRCGSVITVVNDGRSLYGRVSKFFSVNGNSCPGYASVTWFGFPTYPFDNPLVVRVHKNGDELDDRYGCIIPITLIDPSPIVIEPDTDGLHYFMMRLSGYDTIRS